MKIALLCLIVTALGQHPTNNSVNAPQQDTSKVAGSVESRRPDSAAVGGQARHDTITAAPGGIGVKKVDTSAALPHAPPAAANQGSQQTKKIAIIKKDINYSVFIKLAVGMMCFIALFYTSVQTWNPD